MEESSQFMQAYDSHRKSHFFLPKATKLLLYSAAGLGLFMLFVFTTESLDTERLQAYSANTSMEDITDIAIRVHSIQEEATEVHVESPITPSMHTGAFDPETFVLFWQGRSQPWSGRDYGSCSVAVGGCGLCASAMVLRNITNDESINPGSVLDECPVSSYSTGYDDGNYCHNVLTHWFRKLGIDDEWECSNVIYSSYTVADIKSTIDAGGLLIGDAHAGVIAPSGGHYHVIFGYEGDYALTADSGFLGVTKNQVSLDYLANSADVTYYFKIVPKE